MINMNCTHLYFHSIVELQEKGITCMYDNKTVASSCHLLILCVLPSQLPAIGEEIKGHISPRCLVYRYATTCL